MGKAATKRGTEWRAEFLFLGNQLALDFLNTRPVPADAPIELLSDFRALLNWFQAAKLLSISEVRTLQKRWGESTEARKTLVRVRRLREMLRAELLRWERGEAIRPTVVSELNRLMTLYPMKTRLLVDPGGAVEQAWFEAREPEDLVAPLARSAAALFANVDRKRVRKCAHCVLHFQDISKKGTRRWCSMQLCGNRLKVAAYAARQRSRP